MATADGSTSSLRDGRIHFEGTREELLASPDSYLKEFLMTLLPW